MFRTLQVDVADSKVSKICYQTWKDFESGSCDSVSISG